jgi:hypothetical protein
MSNLRCHLSQLDRPVILAWYSGNSAANGLILIHI